MAEPANGLKPSAQELAALEQAFAQDPSSEAFRQLAEAYLLLERYMEAMVVAKKGAKARPSEPAPRLLLARIYAQQGKEAKALEEVAAALQLRPADLAGLKLQAQLLLKAGQRGPGAEALLKALAAAPDDPEVAQLMARHGVQPPPPPSPPPALARAAPVAAAGAASGGPAVQRASEPLPAAARQAAALRAQTTALQVSLDLARLAEEEERKAQEQRRAGPRLLLTGGFLVLGLVALAGWALWGRHKSERDHQIAALMKKTTELMAHDSYASYQEAEKSAQKALELDPSNFAADAHLAYINALRFGENGEGEEYLKRAQDYLAAAKAANKPHSHLWAAEAYILFFQHQPAPAEAELKEVLERKGPTGERLYSSNLLSGALGIIQLQEGKLAEARKNLLDAHTYAAADVRVTAALGTVDARQNSPSTAESFFSSALKVDPDHVPSLLGLAQLYLESEPPDIGGAEKALKHLAQLGAGALSPRQGAFAKFLEAQLLYAQGKAGLAAEAEKGAFALDAKNPEMLLVAGRRLRRANQPDKAIAMVRQAIELDPNRGSFYAELGEAYLAVPNGAANAVAQLGQAISRVPPSARLLSLLGEAYRKQGNLDAAAEQWRAALKLDSEDVDTHLRLARLYLQKADGAKAQAEFDAVAKRGQGAALAEADTELGKAAMDRGDGAKARDLFTNAIGANGGYAPPYFFIGKLLSGDRSKRPQARNLLAQYLKLQPEGPFAAEAKRLAK